MRAILVLCVAVAAGCSLAPPFEVPQVAAPAAYGAPGTWEAAAPADALPRGPWWERYADPTLNDLEAEFATASPDLGVAVARYDQARALAAEAGAGLFPVVGAAALATRNRQSDNRPLRSPSQPAEYHDYVLGGVASYELDLWGRVRNTAAAGRATAQASAADLASVRLSLEAEIGRAHV